MKLGRMLKMPRVAPKMSQLTGIKMSDLELPSIKPKRRKRPTIKSIIKNV